MAESVEKYHQITHVEHILKRPDTYIGGIEKENKELYIYDEETNKFKKRQMEYIEGFMRIHMEIIYNSIDNISRSKERGLTCDMIKIEINRESKRMSVTNNGLSIPIVKNDNNEYIPEMLFGNLMAGSNFDDTEDRYTTGRNGLGAKLTNIYSKYFEVEINDPKNELIYKQTWTDNISNKGEAIIEKSKNVVGYVKITWSPDFEYFRLEKEYTDDQIELLKKVAYDIAGNALKCAITFNGIRIRFKTFVEYCGLYKEGLDKEVINIRHKQIELIEEYESNVVITGAYERNSNISISFINNLYTIDNGKHYSLWSDKILNAICEKLSKKNNIVEQKDIKKFFNIIVSCRMKNPTFKSQNKAQLTGSKDIIDTGIDIGAIINKISKWEIMNKIKEYLESKEDAKLKKTTDTRKRAVHIENYDAANKAGTKQSRYCSLLLCEGLSAKTYAVVGMSYIMSYMRNMEYNISEIEKDENKIKGRDWMGIYPLRGVPLNSRNATMDQISKNREITDIIKILNIEKDLDYNIKENYEKLTYGKVIILTDADTDGSRIKGLLLNIFHDMFKSLLSLSYIVCMKTPILKIVTRRQKEALFYNEYIARRYIEVYKNEIKEIKYYKGLGTSNNEDIKNSFAKFMEILKYDDKTDNMMDVMFNKKKNYSDDRKVLIERFKYKINDNDIEKINEYISKTDKEAAHITTNKTVNISSFIKNDMVEFSIANCKRAIPHIMDGLKQSQRKILYGIFLKKLNYESKSIKVAQLSGYVSEKTNYHHGEQNLCETIIKMAQSYVGTNNIPLLYADGQFGCLSRDEKVLLWSGEIKRADEITIKDKLIGDDGNIRNILKLIHGYDNMYEIIQYANNSYNYKVNGEHILTLICTIHKKIQWKEHNKTWYLYYFDMNTLKLREKTIKTNDENEFKINKDEGYKKIYDFSKNISDNNIYDIKLNDYMSMTEATKGSLKGVKNSKCINWNRQNVPIDPYIYGAWLCNGDDNGCGFLSYNKEMTKQWVIWADTINAEITHKDDEGSHYSIRRKGLGELLRNKVDKRGLNGVKSPYEVILKRNNLYEKKRILKKYMINDKKTRLELLAGFIDSDETLHNKLNYCISKSYEKHKELIYKLQYIANSLGYITYIRKDKYNIDGLLMMYLHISGDNMDEIPVKLEHKRIKSNNKKNKYNVNIEVKYIGKDEYYGWKIDKNERFLLKDYTITHNSRSLLGEDAASPRYIFTKLNKYTRLIYNNNDDYVLKNVIDDGDEVEPEYYVPIIPMILVNGCKGIATGFSTEIINFNVFEIIKYIKYWLKNDIYDDNITINPWYKGFEGKIKQINEMKWDTFGVYNYDGISNTISVYEIPVLVSIKDFKDNLDKLICSKKIISYNNYSTENKPVFVIKTTKQFNGDVLTLIPKSRSSLSISNMTLYDVNYVLRKFNNVYDIIKYYCEVRLDHYDKRKKYMIDVLETELIKISNKHRFILHVIDDNTIVFKKRNEEITKKLEEYEYEKIDETYDYLLNINVKSFTYELLEKLKKMLESKTNELLILKAKDIKSIWYDDIDVLFKMLQNDNYFN
jgi:DNA gyrase/topoisomerase IV subunit B